MKPYSRKEGKIRVRNKNKHNSVPDKQRKLNFKVSNPTNFWETFAVGGNVLRSRLRKLLKRGLNKENKIRYYQDKL